MEYLSKTTKQTEEIAKNFIKNHIFSLENRGGAFVVGLYGDLGSGKTTFVNFLAKHLGIQETIQSPTFVIMKSYKLLPKEKKLSNFPTFYFEALIHIDAYRIEKDDQMIKFNWNEII